MKQTTTSVVLTALIFICSFLQLSGQDKKYPEPDLLDKLYYFDQSNRASVEMEYGIIQETERSKGYFKGEEMLMEYNHEKSMVRIKKSDKICFLIKMNSEELDVMAQFTLLKLTSNPKTKKREIITGKTDAWTSNTNSKLIKIMYTVKKVVEERDQYDNLRLVIRQISVVNLEPGEYAFVETGTSQCAFFGVD